MGVGETTILFYLLIGGGVAVAVWLAEDELATGELTFRTISAMLFWPIYLPVLLKQPNPPAEDELHSAAKKEPVDGMSTAISQVEAELDAALCSLDGWAEESLSHEQQRLCELRTAWHLQAERVRELDRLLSRPEYGVNVTRNADPIREGEAPAEPGNKTDSAQPISSERILHSEQARNENIKRLKDVRRQLHDDLMGTLAWVRELVTMIHLAKFTGAPPSRAEELVAQIAASVEGLSEVTHWQEETELVGTV